MGVPCASCLVLETSTPVIAFATAFVREMRPRDSVFLSKCIDAAGQLALGVGFVRSPRRGGGQNRRSEARAGREGLACSLDSIHFVLFSESERLFSRTRVRIGAEGARARDNDAGWRGAAVFARERCG